jgi:tripartite ATP-independent transporter DctP family solute receptor
MQTKRLFCAAAVLVAALFAVALVPVPADAAAKTIKLHHLNKDDPFDNATGAMATVFKSLVEAGTNGGIAVQTFPNGQLGKDNDVVAQVKSGVIQSGIHSVGGFASIYPMMGVIDVPFVFPSISATYAVFDGPFGQKLAADIEAKTGLKVLGFGDSGGFFHFTNSKRPITSPEDMKGLKIRTMGLDTHKAVVTAMGGQPAVIAWTEVYTALQTGVADGQMNPVPIISFAKFNEVQKFLTLSGHLFAPYVWVMNKEFYNGLTPVEKSVIADGVKSGIVAGRGVSRAIEASDRGLAGLSKDMKVNALTPEQLVKFRNATMPEVKKIIVEKHGAEGEAMMKAFLEAVETASK